MVTQELFFLATAPFFPPIAFLMAIFRTQKFLSNSITYFPSQEKYLLQQKGKNGQSKRKNFLYWYSGSFQVKNYSLIKKLPQLKLFLFRENLNAMPLINVIMYKHEQDNLFLAFLKKKKKKRTLPLQMVI